MKDDLGLCVEGGFKIRKARTLEISDLANWGFVERFPRVRAFYV